MLSNERLNEGSVCVGGTRKLLHQAIVETHQLIVVVKFEDQLARTHFRFLVKKHFRPKVALEFVERRSNVRIEVNLYGRPPARSTP